MEIERALVHRIELLAEEFADLPLSEVVRVVTGQAELLRDEQTQAGSAAVDVSSTCDLDEIAAAARAELCRCRRARSDLPVR